ncbi:MAG: Grx4 family monothiol glutaredoxin [Alphaproteobacteria bacterium]|nr:MAG: Grx4 family monothiol glutaredoxin [Alphaproteobacteria bacterium]
MESYLTPELKDLFTQQVNAAPVVLYMKGTASQPMCGFSARAVGILNNLNVPFADYNVLDSDELRMGLKEFSNWPTFPQLYVNGELIGGADIMIEMHQSGELAEMLNTQSKQ